MSLLLIQHASADVEKMVLGNKCDINDKRQVSKDRGENVRSCHRLIYFMINDVFTRLQHEENVSTFSFSSR